MRAVAEQGGAAPASSRRTSCVRAVRGGRGLPCPSRRGVRGVRGVRGALPVPAQDLQPGVSLSDRLAKPREDRDSLVATLGGPRSAGASLAFAALHCRWSSLMCSCVSLDSVQMTPALRDPRRSALLLVLALVSECALRPAALLAAASPSTGTSPDVSPLADEAARSSLPGASPPLGLESLALIRDAAPSANREPLFNPWPRGEAGSGHDYGEILRLSLLFYESQRSGRLPADNRIPWRGDSALDDRGLRGEDLSGGYYDASDFVKFSFTMAFTTTLLAWGLVAYGDAYRAAGQWDAGTGAVRWAADYFVRCHVAPSELYGQVGDFGLDHRYWGRPEELNMSRPAYKIDREHPGSDLAGETAAALAAVSMVARASDPEYADECLRHARQLYAFATEHRGFYHDAIKGGAQYYESTDYGDELCWAAAWLYYATKDRYFLEEAENHYTQFVLHYRPGEFSLNRKVAGVQVLLAQLTGREEYRSAARSFCDHSALRQKRTPKGLVYVEKAGTLSHAANIAFVCLQAADAGVNPELYREFARGQIDYMLGDGGRSYVVGYGDRWPRQPHHAASSCPDRPQPCGWPDFSKPSANPQVLHGALVSGPDENDYYEDVRREFAYNEVTLDYNAGFQSAVAGLHHLRTPRRRAAATE